MHSFKLVWMKLSLIYFVVIYKTINLYIYIYIFKVKAEETRVYYNSFLNLKYNGKKRFYNEIDAWLFNRDSVSCFGSNCNLLD